MAGLLAALAITAPAAAAPNPKVSAQPVALQRELCAAPIRSAERRHRIPGQLLAAVALAESGRYLGSNRAGAANIAWPWTVTSGTRSWFLPSRDAAIGHVRRLQATGVRNIDVGCMQVNLRYHPAAFPTLKDAFDPWTNVAYAAAHLTALFEKRRSWTLAVGLYHSATPRYQIPYKRKVIRLWNAERRRAAAERRARTLARIKADRRARIEARAEARKTRLRRMATGQNTAR